MRDLASICTIEKVWPLEGKDKVQGAGFKENAYEVMVSKDIQPDMLVAFIQEGAVLPVCETWEWLRKRCYRDNLNGKEGFLIKPQKFSGIKSWGLAVPLNELGLDESVTKKFKAGDDISGLLGIWKYEPAEDASPTKGESKKAYPKWVKFCLGHTVTRWIGRIWQKRHQNSGGGFPDHVLLKSDETTVQNMPFAIEKFADELVYISAKMEGQSATTCFDPKKSKKDGLFYVCSRNNAYKLKCNNDFWNYCVNNGMEKKLRDYYRKTGKLLAVQAEQCGPGIQNNIYNFKSLKWFVYLMTDIITGNQLNYDEMVSACKDLGLTIVPVIVANVKLKDVMPTLSAAVKYAEKSYWTLDENGELIQNYQPKEGEKLWVDYFQNEGVVVRSMNCDKKKNIGLSMKIKNIDYASHNLGEIYNMAFKKIAIKK